MYIYSLKVETSVLFNGFSEDSSPGGVFSNGSRVQFLKDKRGVIMYEFFATKKKVIETSKDYHYLKKIRHLKYF